LLQHVLQGTIHKLVIVNKIRLYSKEKGYDMYMQNEI